MKYSIGKISSLLNAGLDKNPVAKTEVGGYIKKAALDRGHTEQVV